MFFFFVFYLFSFSSIYKKENKESAKFKCSEIVALLKIINFF